MKEYEPHHIIKLRYAYTLQKLLHNNKLLMGEDRMTKDRITNANQLAFAIDLRPATISKILTGQAIPNGLTLYMILEGLSKSFSQFAEIFDKATMEELAKFEQTLNSYPKHRGRRKLKNNP